GAERVHQQLAGQPRLQAEMLTVLGRVYAGLGVFPSADSVLDDALRLLRQAGMPAEAAVPLSVRASSARQQGEFARADSLLQQVLATYAAGGRTPDSLHAETLSERGLVLGYLGRYDEALALHQQALA